MHLECNGSDYAFEYATKAKRLPISDSLHVKYDDQSMLLIVLLRFR